MEDNESNDFEIGWGFPPAFDYQSGSVEVVRGSQDVKESLMILLRTRVGERVMEQDYGCDLMPLAFQQLDLNLETFMVNNIEQAICEYEPRVDVLSVRLMESNGGQGAIDIQITYKLKKGEGEEVIQYSYNPVLNK